MCPAHGQEQAGVLGGLLAALLVAALFVLGAVLDIVLFAITVAYVLYPIRQRIAGRGLRGRLASAITTTIGFLFVVVVFAPLVFVVYRRREQFLDAIDVLQATTAVATFAIALGLFLVLGYAAPVSLAVVAGILQFVPIVGPSVLLAVLAGGDVLAGNPVRATSVLLFGLTLVAFLPDAVIRTALAGLTGEIASSLYFVGFVGGILTIGPIGIIVGPLVVALLAEVVRMLSEGQAADRPASR